VAYFFGKSPVSWLSQKQKVVAQSTYEAEYIAAATAACQGVWLRRLLGDLMNKEEERVVLNIDNKSAISSYKNPVHHDRSKHTDTKYHYIRECVEESKIEVNYVCVCTDDQLDDILTKSLSTEVLGDVRKDRRPSCEDKHIVLSGVIVRHNHVRRRYGVVCFM
jgi:hypothetical protein